MGETHSRAPLQQTRANGEILLRLAEQGFRLGRRHGELHPPRAADPALQRPGQAPQRVLDPLPARMWAVLTSRVALALPLDHVVYEPLKQSAPVALKGAEAMAAVQKHHHGEKVRSRRELEQAAGVCNPPTPVIVPPTQIKQRPLPAAPAGRQALPPPWAKLWQGLAGPEGGILESGQPPHLVHLLQILAGKMPEQRLGLNCALRAVLGGEVACNEGAHLRRAERLDGERIQLQAQVRRLEILAAAAHHHARVGVVLCQAPDCSGLVLPLVGGQLVEAVQQQGQAVPLRELFDARPEQAQVLADVIPQPRVRSAAGSIH